MQHDARPQLRALRVARGWTQQDVADRLTRLAWMRKPRKNVGCKADMVGKWENGRKGVSPLYRELLAKLYGVTIAQLGIEPDGEAASDPAPTDRSLLAFLDTATGLLDQLGAAGAVLQPQLFALWKDEIANRRAMFALLDPLTADVGTTQSTSAPLDLEAIEQLADTFERLFETADPAALLTPVAAHVRLIGDALCAHPSAGTRGRLLRVRARTGILAGRLSFERLRNPMSARAFYSAAHDDARELGDPALRAQVLGRTAMIAAAEGRIIAAREDIDTARALVPSESPLWGWLVEIADTTVGLGLGQQTSAA